MKMLLSANVALRIRANINIFIKIFTEVLPGANARGHRAVKKQQLCGQSIARKTRTPGV
jgi:hypothetical protein